MEINILHLYYDLMDLYGEYGNVKIIQRHFQDQGFEVNIDKLSIDDDIDFLKYNFVYIGSGTEKNQLVVAEHMLKYKENIKEAIAQNIVILATGNAKELFGKSIVTVDNKEYEMLGVLQFVTHRLKDKECYDIIYDCDLIHAKVVGFVNKMGNIIGNEYPLFKVEFGIGDSTQDKFEGYKFNKLYGTYVIGPLFARNPLFLKHIMQEILDNKTQRFELKDIDYPYEQKGYDIVLHELTQRLNQEKQ